MTLFSFPSWQIHDLFLSFDDTPLGAASLAQVHKAVLHDGRTVAVKVQHPKVQAQSSKDILLMEVGASPLLSRFLLRSLTASQILTQAGGWTVALSGAEWERRAEARPRLCHKNLESHPGKAGHFLICPEILWDVYRNPMSS